MHVRLLFTKNFDVDLAAVPGHGGTYRAGQRAKVLAPIAAYAIARGIAKPADTMTAEFAEAVDAINEAMSAMRGIGLEPTLEAVLGMCVASQAGRPRPSRAGSVIDFHPRAML